MTVVGVAPAEEASSAFVVQVTGKLGGANGAQEITGRLTQRRKGDQEPKPRSRAGTLRGFLCAFASLRAIRPPLSCSRYSQTFDEERRTVGSGCAKVWRSSVATAERIMRAARRALRAKQDGKQVIVVVSAPRRHHDELISLAREICDQPRPRNDMLLSHRRTDLHRAMAMAIQSLGQPAISFTGAQIGIVTDSFHTKARIKNISTARIRQALNEGKIVIVAGFQGIDEAYNITTLAVGSDTTAVALAAVMKQRSGRQR